MQKTACSALAPAQRWSVMLIWGALHVTWVTLAEAPEYVAGRPVLAGNAVCSSRNGIALPDRLRLQIVFQALPPGRIDPQAEL
ncbi:hypothetical protein, partial [Xanthomonas perforans]